MKSRLLLFLMFFIIYSISIHAQEKKDEKSAIEKLSLSGLKMRNIGPAFTSGRIADIAVHPQNDNVWYVAVGSGGVWKTENSGTTWTPVFDNEVSYSIGCITIDPVHNQNIWVGTGENVGGRHVGFGDGIYKSEDEGKSWKHMGLKDSEHISEIIVHPNNSNKIFVAVQGPLWSKGGERGFYLTEDGGKTWTRTLGDDEWVGVTDIAMDPRNPDILYAATWQRHRTVANYIGGGPGSGLHRSMDGGKTWEKLTKGIPGSNLGKIGLAISPFNPDVIYAAIELDRTKGGVFISTDMGKSWNKQSDAVAGATGPHYYQELYASPHHEGTIYLVDSRIQVSDDHGKTFRRLNENDKHSDNHSINFRDDDPDYLLIGTDGGIYESFDLASTWRYIDNLPITQFYKVAVDDAMPFYWVFGGTQDNGSQGGPSRTDTQHGIRNDDWIKTLGADGHQSATEPGNPNILYAETQQGGLNRVDRLTGEQIYIQPQAMPGEKFERFNWDAPILVSPHKPSRIYFASYRVWKSENRGDDWETISGDLTRDQERFSLPIMGRVQSWDNPFDVNAMSDYNTITSLSESPIQEGLLYAGTDDGIVQVTENGGGEWRKVELSAIKGAPSTGFVNDIRADLYDASTAYLCVDNHKYGDFKPYLFKTTDKGKTWNAITGNLPERLLIWRIVQDHVNPELLFAATEFGIYFTVDGGKKWLKLKAGVPNIAFRDITIQRRENDLVGASFGRGFFILDDYTPLRQLNEALLEKEAHLFPVKNAYWYTPRSITGSQGSSYFTAPNPPHGPVFTYYLKENIKSLRDERKEKEKALNKESKDIDFPGWEALEKEKHQEDAVLVFTIKDSDGKIVKVLESKPSTGINRVNWNMRTDARTAIRLGQTRDGFGGALALPGTYMVEMSLNVDGVMTALSEPQSFELIPLREGALPRKDDDVILAFKEIVDAFADELTAASFSMDKAEARLQAYKIASKKVTSNMEEMVKLVHDAQMAWKDLDTRLNGSDVKDEIGERYAESPRGYLRLGTRSLNTTHGPTTHQMKVVSAAATEFEKYKIEIAAFLNRLDDIEGALQVNGAPWIEGMDR